LANALGTDEQNDKQSADIAKACEVLLSYAILQTYEERADMLETLEDVTTAVKAMFAPTKKSKGKKADDEDPEAIDLLVDTLIALLDKNSGGLRSLATMVLALTAPALTASTIEHLLAVSLFYPCIVQADD
jgi:DNA polymerase phi